MKLFFLFILILLFSTSLFAGSSLIVPADKEKIVRLVGESVYVECKKQPPYSDNCQVDCGNGRHYRKTKGYCHYLSTGTFVLNVSTRYRNKTYLNTAVVSITDERTQAPDQLARKKSHVKHNEPQKLDTQLMDENAIANSQVNPVVLPLAQVQIQAPSDTSNLKDDVIRSISSAPVPVAGAGDILQNNIENNLLNTDTGVEVDFNSFSNQDAIEQINTQTDTGFGRDTQPPVGGVSNNNLNNQNRFNDQFVQQ